MERLFKRLSAAVIALAVFAAAVVFDLPKKNTAEAALSETATGGCDGDHDGWTEWTGQYISEGGKYYLQNDITLTREIPIDGGKNITICLNGYTVNADNKYRIFNIDNGTLTLCDCNSSGNGNGKLTGGYSYSDGAAVYIGTKGVFNMNGGTISGNTVTNGNGGGVYVNSMDYARGEFIMNGGTISGNTAKCNGGGVCAYGTFIMNGGTITGNTADSGGSGYSGGGVFLGRSSSSSYIFNGKVDISNNNCAGSENNVYIPNDKTITIGSNFHPLSKIGVNTEKTPTCSTPIAVTVFANDAKAEDISASFTADIDIEGQSIGYKDGKVQLTKDHNYNTAWTTDDEKHWHKCQYCTETTDEADHTGGTATCAEKAVCETCEQEYGELKEHTYGAWSITKDPSTTATGTAERTCSCGEKETKTDVPALNDSTVWTKDDTQHVEPTEETTGKDVYTSEDYGEVTVTLPQKGHTHNLDHVDEIPATETTEGTKDHWHCDGCGKDFADEDGTNEISDLTIPVIGHTHDLTHVDEVPATEEEDGVKEHWHCDGCGKDFADEDGETELSELELTIPKLGKLEIDVEKSETAPATELKTTPDELKEAVLSDEDIENIDSKDIKIVLKVEDATNKVSDEDKAAVGTAVGSLTIGQYLNIDLFKIIDEAEEKVTETSAPLTITFTIPAELRGSGRTFSVIRVHDGETTVLEDKDSDPNTVTIETDKFSTYALAYSAAQTSPGGESEGGSGGTAVTPVDPVSPESKPNGGDGASPSESAPQSGSSSASDQSSVNSDNSAASSGENTSASGGGSQSDNKGNPSTGVAVSLSLIPFITALALFTIAFKRVK